MVVFKAVLGRDLSGHLLEYQGVGIGECLTRSVIVVTICVVLVIAHGFLSHFIT